MSPEKANDDTSSSIHIHEGVISPPVKTGTGH